MIFHGYVVLYSMDIIYLVNPLMFKLFHYIRLFNYHTFRRIMQNAILNPTPHKLVYALLAFLYPSPSLQKLRRE